MNENICGKYGCWWEGSTGVSPNGIQCGECYPDYTDKCPLLNEVRDIYNILLGGCNDVDCIECEGRKLKDGCLKYHQAWLLYNANYRKQKKGKWTERRWSTEDDWGCINHRSIECSACKIEIYKGEPTEYCPHCGAEMEETVGRR